MAATNLIVAYRYMYLCMYFLWLILRLYVNKHQKAMKLQSSLSWEATLFSLWKWPQKAGGLKSEIVFVINYHAMFWPSGLKTKGGLSSQRPFKAGLTGPLTYLTLPFWLCFRVIMFISATPNSSQGLQQVLIWVRTVINKKVSVLLL